MLGASCVGTRRWAPAGLLAGLALLAAVAGGAGSALAQPGWDKVVADFEAVLRETAAAQERVLRAGHAAA